jgi:hypothetical protein
MRVLREQIDRLRDAMRRRDALDAHQALATEVPAC